MLDRDLGYRGLTPEQRRNHRSFDVVAQGVPGTKIIEGREYLATPSLLVDRRGNFFLGCGLPEKGLFYNSLWGGYPEVIRGWRSLRILEELPVVDNGNLHAIWETTQKDGLRNRYSVDTLTPSMGGEQRVRDIHTDIMGRGPTQEELRQMILKTQAAGVEVDGWELKREAEAGIITVTPLVAGIIEEAMAESAAFKERHDRQEAELKIPLPGDESLGKLFQQLEIGNIIVGVPFGGYGLDWGFTPAEKVDRDLKGSSFYGDHPRPLFRSTKVPTFESEDILPGVTQTTVSIGEIVPISWKDERTRTKVVFKDARFSDGHIYLTTVAEGSEGQNQETVYTVAEFREKFDLTV